LPTPSIIAFGATRKVGVRAAEDAGLQSLLQAGTPAIAIFGKAWDYQVLEILRTTLDENLRMISDTVRYLKQHGKEVVFDAEHFFDGYKANAAHALEALAAAAEAGADSIALCDTNGGSLPEEIFAITRSVCTKFPQAAIGIHCHNDSGMAVANSVRAVQAGATQVQGTINGLGERCGNANLCSIIPNLQLKLGLECIPEAAMRDLTSVARAVSEIANMPHNEKAPYVGGHAFAHKGGMHIDAVVKDPVSYEHIDPELVGNSRRVLMSEVAGRSTLLARINAIDPNLTKDSPETRRIIDKLKELEHEGYQFEAAESSFDLVVRKMLGRYTPFFELVEFKVITNEPAVNDVNSSVIIKVRVGDQDVLTVAEGDGPVNALDKAVRKALERLLPGHRRNPPDRLQGARAGFRQGLGRQGARADRVDRRQRRAGRPSACRPTSSMLPGRRWSMPWMSSCCAIRIATRTTARTSLARKNHGRQDLIRQTLGLPRRPRRGRRHLPDLHRPPPDA
jgi:2-isopropylmalate synthase